jgi:hypothetical protein
VSFDGSTAQSQGWSNVVIFRKNDMTQGKPFCPIKPVAHPYKSPADPPNQSVMTLLKSPARHPTPHNLSWPTSNVAFDMDSTINIECVDEIAGRAGRKAEVAAITEGYAGDYHRLAVDSLRQRVALLKGVRVQHGRGVYREGSSSTRARPSWSTPAKKGGLKTRWSAVASRFTNDRIRDDMDYTRSNVLGVEDGF